MITKSKKIIQTQRKIRIFPHESHEKQPLYTAIHRSDIVKVDVL